MKNVQNWPAAAPQDERIEPSRECEFDCVDEASEESFPASDAPAWTSIVAIGPPSHSEDVVKPAAPVRSSTKPIEGDHAK
jgi:hypothetical protein